MSEKTIVTIALIVVAIGFGFAGLPFVCLLGFILAFIQFFFAKQFYTVDPNMNNNSSNRPTGIMGIMFSFAEGFYNMLNGVDNLPFILKIPAYPICLVIMASVLAIGLLLTPIWLPVCVFYATFCCDRHDY